MPMLEDHAIIPRGEYRVPLLGIPPDARLQECDLCHDNFSLREIELTETGQILCRECRERSPALNSAF